jgi:hypothetical protein
VQAVTRREQMTPRNDKGTASPPEFASLGAFLAELFASVIIAWFLPGGINWLFRLIGKEEPLRNLTPESHVGIFLVSALLLYGFVVTRACAGYLHRVFEMIQENLPITIGNRLEGQIDRSIQESVEGNASKGSR